MKRIFAALLVVLLGTTSVFATGASEIALGRAALAAHDLVSAQTHFTNAVAANDASKQTAGALLGFTQVFALAGLTNTASTAGTAQSGFLNTLNVQTSGRDVYGWKAKLPHDVNGNLVLPTNYNLTAVEAFWQGTLISTTSAARSNLALVTDTSFLVTLYPSETTGPAAVNIDYGDVLMSRASLSALEFVFHFLSGQNLDANLDALNQLAQGNLLTLQQLLANNPNLFNLKAAGGSTTERAAALASLTDFITVYRQASTFIRARPPGLSRLFMLASSDLVAEADFRGRLDKVQRSLTEPVANDKGNKAVFLGPLFGSSWVMRQQIPNFSATTGGFDLESITDTSLGGVITGETREEIAGVFNKAELGWTWVTPQPQGGSISRYLALPGGKHVAAGDAGMVLTSSDGTTWVVHSIAHEGTVTGLATNGTVVVAVTQPGNIYLSTDAGATWKRTAAAGSAFGGVTFGGGKFVAVGDYGQTAVSTDGQTWTVNSPPSGGNSLYDVLYTGSVYLAVGQMGGTAVIASSTDGVSWNTNFTAGSSGYPFNGIAQGGGKFVAVGGGNHGAVSTNGTSWTASTLFASSDTTTYFNGVGYFNGRFVAAAGTGTIATSADGATGVWTSVASGETTPLGGVSVSASAVYVTGGAGLILKSTDSAAFSRTLSPQAVAPLTGDGLFSIRALAGELYAVGGAGTIVHSSDGLAYSAVTASGTTQRLWSILQQGSAYYAVGNAGTLVTATTPSGTWTAAATLGGGANFRSISYLNNGLFVITGNNAKLLTSPDGTTWTARTTLGAPTTSDFLYGAAYGNGVYVAVGGNNNNFNYVFTSADGATWTKRSLPTTSTFRAVVFNQGYFTAVGSYGAIFRSADGINWSAVNSPTQADLGALSVRDGRYYAAASTAGTSFGSSYFVANQTAVLVSSDGLHWVQTDRGTSNNAYSVELFNGRIYTSGDNYSILRSELIAASTVPATPLPLAAAPTTAVTQGTEHTLAVRTDASGGQTFVWKKGSTVIPGVTGPILDLINVQSGDGSAYTATVTNAAGTSPAATFTFNVSASAAAPTITQQPATQTVSVGLTATFSVTATGTSPLTYQWKKNTGTGPVNLTDGPVLGAATVSGSTTAMLTLTGVQAADAAAYTVVVTGASPPATSLAATLTVDSNPAYTFSTLAGFGFNSGLVNATGSAARFSSPYCVTVDGSGNVYVADTNNGAIRKITPAGVVTTLASGSLGSPIGITLVGSTLYFTTSGQVVRSIGTDGTGLAVLVGLVGSSGSTDAPSGPVAGAGGTSSPARFNNPKGITADASGNLYVADTGNNKIRKIVITSGAVSTLAGSGSSGFANGTGTAAQFNGPQGVAVDPTGTNLFVADTYNNLIRKIVPSTGAVTTFAGQGYNGENDGPGTAAGFANPQGIAVDSIGYVFVGDNNGRTIRKIAPDGSFVRTIGGESFVVGSLDGLGSMAQFNTPNGLALDSAGNLYVADTISHTIRKGAPSVIAAMLSAPAISFSAGNQTVTVGGSVNLTVNAIGPGPFTYVWRKNGVPLVNGGNVIGATSPTLTLNGLQAGDTGNYTVLVTNSVSSAVSPVATLTVSPGPQITFQPGPQTVPVGGFLNLKVGVLADPTQLTYQWQKDGVALVDGATGSGSAISGSSTGAVTVTNVQTTDAGHYALMVTNSSGGAISSVATVVVYAAEPYTFGTLAGRSALGAEDGTGTAARFNGPCGVTRDSAGNLYVTDFYNHTIRKVTTAGAVTTYAGMAGAPGSTDGPLATARFNFPQAIAADSSDNLYVACGDGTIRKITAAGTVSTWAGLSGSFGSVDDTGSPGTARFGSTLVLTVDAAGNVYVGDTSFGTIRKITPAGLVLTLAGLANNYGSSDGTGSAARFASPAALAVDGAGTLYVADAGNHTIRTVVTSTGLVSTLWGSAANGSHLDGTGTAARFISPRGLALNGGGTLLYVSDYSDETIRLITLAGGNVATLAGTTKAAGNLNGTGTATKFYAPRGLLVDATGANVYVADAGNNDIRQLAIGAPTAPVAATTVVTNLAGSLPTAGSANGAGSVARFSYPQGPSLDSAGNLYVADEGNNTIRKIAPDATVSLFSGTAGVSATTDGPVASALFNGASGVAVDTSPGNQGNLYIADSANNTIRKYTVATGNVTTFAGQPGVTGTADGTGGAAQFNYPNSVVVDGSGNVYVADEGNHTVRKITPGGTVSTLAGMPGASGYADGTGSAARFNNPNDVAVDSNGNVYVADYSNQRLRKITPGGIVTTVLFEPGFAGCVGVDAANNVYASGSHNVVFKITPAGVVTAIGGLSGNIGSADGTGSVARFNGPLGVKVDGSGNVYVADSYSNTIRKGYPFVQGALTTPLVPQTLAVGGALTIKVVDLGNGTAYQWMKDGVPVYNGVMSSGSTIAGATTAVLIVTGAQAADSGHYSVRVSNYGENTVSSPVTAVVYASEPYNFLTLAGRAAAGTDDAPSGPGSAARFNGPSSVVRDSHGNLFVMDSMNGAIRKIVPATGAVTTFAGMSGYVGSADGTGGAAQFNANPSRYVEMAIDSADNLYVADTGNHTVRKITPAGVVSTLAGLAGNPGSTDGSGSAARFNLPEGIAVDLAGNVYVSEAWNRTIRKITPAGSVTTLAGPTGVSPAAVGPIGNVDATGTAARFGTPQGLAVDGAGNVYVADQFNKTIRMVTPAGVVTTIAGTAGSQGTADGGAGGALTAARFSSPFGVAVNPAALATGVAATTLYLSDGGAVRKLVLGTATVTTLAGSSTSGEVDDVGPVAKFASPYGLTVDAAETNLYVADSGNNTIRALLLASNTVTTLAGSSSTVGSTNGVGGVARFNGPEFTAPDGLGNLYVADSGNNVIRKIDATGNVTTFAGTAGVSGSTDGAALGTALFNSPAGLAVDGSGNIYVSDNGNRTIRKITLTPTVTVSTFAGTAGANGSADGTGPAAQFAGPLGLAVDGAGNVYVADQPNQTIRLITPSGVVTTFAGLARGSGYVDGSIGVARFNNPWDVAVDSSGNVYVADRSNQALRKITPAGVVSTVLYEGNLALGVGVDAAGTVYATGSIGVVFKITSAGTITAIGGLAPNSGSADGVGPAARFASPFGVRVDSAGNVYVADTGNNTIRKGGVQTVTSVSPATGKAGDSITINGTYLTGLTGVQINGVAATSFAFVSNTQVTAVLPVGVTSGAVGIVNAGGVITTSSVQLGVLTRDLLALSSLVNVPVGGSTATTFTIEGAASKQILIEGIGGASANGGNATGTLADPRLTLFDSAGVQIGTPNSSWGTNANAATITTISSAVGTAPGLVRPADAALLVSLVPGTYTARLDSVSGVGGIALLQVYDTDTGASGSPHLVMLTTRAPVTSSSNLVTGFTVGGTVSKTFLIRALGESLVGGYNTGVGVLVDPEIDLYRGTTYVAHDDDWQYQYGPNPATVDAIVAAAAAVGARPLSNSLDSAILVTLAPGVYTLRVYPYSNSGETQLEIFEVDASRPTTFAPVITYTPNNQQVAQGGQASFGVDVVAKPAAAVSYQWRRNGVNLSDGTTAAGSYISGSRTAVLSLSNVQGADAVNYDVVVSTTGVGGPVTSQPRSLTILSPYHSADTDHDGTISIVELTRVIQLYNYTSGTTRTGEYHTQAGTEDGFAPGPGQITNGYHSADSNHDGTISLAELLRVVALYNYQNGTVRTGQYHSQAGTVDGFAPGPVP